MSVQLQCKDASPQYMRHIHLDKNTRILVLMVPSCVCALSCEQRTQEGRLLQRRPRNDGRRGAVVEAVSLGPIRAAAARQP